MWWVTYMQVTKFSVFQPFSSTKRMVPNAPVSPRCCGKHSEMALFNRPTKMPKSQVTCQTGYLPSCFQKIRQLLKCYFAVLIVYGYLDFRHKTTNKYSHVWWLANATWERGQKNTKWSIVKPIGCYKNAYCNLTYIHRIWTDKDSSNICMVPELGVYCTLLVASLRLVIQSLLQLMWWYTGDWIKSSRFQLVYPYARKPISSTSASPRLLLWLAWWHCFPLNPSSMPKSQTTCLWCHFVKVIQLPIISLQSCFLVILFSYTEQWMD